MCHICLYCQFNRTFGLAITQTYRRFRLSTLHLEEPSSSPADSEAAQEQYLRSVYRFLMCASAVTRISAPRDSSLARTIQSFTEDVLTDVTHFLLQRQYPRPDSYWARLMGVDWFYNVMRQLATLHHRLYTKCIPDELFPDFMRMIYKFMGSADRDIHLISKEVEILFWDRLDAHPDWLDGNRDLAQATGNLENESE